MLNSSWVSNNTLRQQILVTNIRRTEILLTKDRYIPQCAFWLLRQVYQSSKYRARYSTPLAGTDETNKQKKLDVIRTEKALYSSYLLISPIIPCTRGTRGEARWALWRPLWRSAWGKDVIIENFSTGISQIDETEATEKHVCLLLLGFIQASQHNLIPRLHLSPVGDHLPTLPVGWQ